MRFGTLLGFRSQPISSYLNPQCHATDCCDRLRRTAAALTKSKRPRCGEVMGGATAVVCCCPFAAMDMLTLAMYKAPKGMCRIKKAIEKKRRKKKIKRMLKQQAEELGMTEEEKVTVVGKPAPSTAIDLETYDKFYGTGFWRSSSQRSTSV